MTHRRLARPLAFTLGVLLLAGCGGQAPVQLDVAPAATTDAPAATTDAPAATTDAPPPPAEATVVSEVTVTPAETEPSEQPEVDEPEPVEPAVDATEPAVGTSARPTPLTSDPELVIDEDGCATDVATGIVVACHDPAAGPDDD